MIKVIQNLQLFMLKSSILKLLFFDFQKKFGLIIFFSLDSLESDLDSC